MLVVGLTGSVGMGKSFVAARLREFEIPVFDADAVVHHLFSQPDSNAVLKIGEAFPGVVVEGALDRHKLGEKVFGDAEAKKKLEAILHPLILKEKRRFLTQTRLKGEALVVLDIPLLFEVGWEKYCDMVMVVRAPLAVQKKRVLAREGMSESRFESILKNQMPSTEKEARADYIIDTGVTRTKVVRQLKDAIADMIDRRLKGRHDAAP
jgi:dephospho-CoA kinase